MAFQVKSSFSSVGTCMLYSSTVERSFLREAPPKCMNAGRFCTVLRGSIISQPFEPSHSAISNGSRCVFPAMHLPSASPVRNLPLQTSLPSSSRSRKKTVIQKYFKLGIECKLKLNYVHIYEPWGPFLLFIIYTGQDLCCCANQESVPSSQFKIYASYFWRAYLGTIKQRS